MQFSPRHFAITYGFSLDDKHEQPFPVISVLSSGTQNFSQSVAGFAV